MQPPGEIPEAPPAQPTNQVKLTLSNKYVCVCTSWMEFVLQLIARFTDFISLYMFLPVSNGVQDLWSSFAGYVLCDALWVHGGLVAVQCHRCVRLPNTWKIVPGQMCFPLNYKQGVVHFHVCWREGAQLGNRVHQVPHNPTTSYQ